MVVLWLPDVRRATCTAQEERRRGGRKGGGEKEGEEEGRGGGAQQEHQQLSPGLVAQDSNPCTQGAEARGSGIQGYFVSSRPDWPM